ncbi:DUF2946 domain-containing protein [Duganella sp. sic0402]|uniref:DUF2946 domain-containing protein n=1 Tax=Duganella sp. sic0402 TaxID=2854786 RepID=UPI001C47A274|nr:DUF2946 domain-containing protein [Duganella sp. sic0402]MBV7538666.1 DUF2946 domain-containing protein [Duganella sp. sic0402]
MIRLAKRRTLHLWIAMLAILFSALAPTVSHALAAGSSADNTLMLCTVNGYKLIQLPGDGNGDSKAPADAKSMQHCAFCTIHGGADALPAAPAVALLLSAGRDIYPSLFYHAPGAQPIWSAAQQRAPPFLA